MDLFEGKYAFVGNALNAMLGHAVDAAQIAAVGKRYAQIVDLSSLTIFHGVSFRAIVNVRVEPLSAIDWRGYLDTR